MQHSTVPEQKLETSTLKESAANSIAAIVQLQTLLRLKRCLNQIQYRTARVVTNPTVKPDRRYKSSLPPLRLLTLLFATQENYLFLP